MNTEYEPLNMLSIALDVAMLLERKKSLLITTPVPGHELPAIYSSVGTSSFSVGTSVSGHSQVKSLPPRAQNGLHLPFQ